MIVMPAYNAAKTLEATFREIPPGYYDEVIVVDDHSRDTTVDEAKRLSLKAIRHPHNVGYGGNQKTCYMEALRDGLSVCESVQVSRDRKISREGCALYAQTEEWCRWLNAEVGPKIRAAVDALAAAQVKGGT